jgi:hypothetical protein
MKVICAHRKEANSMWVDGLALLWLAPLAFYDLRHRAVPHITTVALPCLLAMIYAANAGTWQLSVLAVTTVLITERYRLRSRRLQPIAFACAVVTSTVLVACSGADAPGAMAIVGFWIAYELGWWAGADALAAITLALVWPDVRLLVSLAAAHLALALLARWARRSASPTLSWKIRRMDAEELERSGAPGLPAMVLAVAMMAAWHLVAMKFR